MAKVENMIQAGIVSDVSDDGKQARVYFPDRNNMVSGWLKVLQRGEDEYEPAVNDKVLVGYLFGTDTDGYVLGGIP